MLAAARFDALLSTLKVSASERTAALSAGDAVRRTLARHYRAPLSVERPRLIGSWDKDTEVRPLRNVDVLVVLPAALEQAGTAGGNLQLELLHDLKAALTSVSADVRLRRDGLAVLVPGPEASVEVLAGFARGGGRYNLCDAGFDGRFRRVAPDAERSRLDESDRRTKGCTRALIRLLKAWQSHRGVPVSSFALEWLAIESLAGWNHESEGSRYYDWMVRNAFAHMEARKSEEVEVPGTAERLSLGSAWRSLARVAHEHAAKACDFETAGRDRDAWWEWEKIFGDGVPMD